MDALQLQLDDSKKPLPRWISLTKPAGNCKPPALAEDQLLKITEKQREHETVLWDTKTGSVGGIPEQSVVDAALASL
jgi:hypothetical protein